MINKLKKLVFLGCSITAGNELYEEAHITDYSKLSFSDARKVAKGIETGKISSWNYDHSFPALTAKELDVEFENLGIPGISNKEIACRALAHFPDDHYEGVVAFLQFTTHNRMLLKYKETASSGTIGSFVVMANADDDRLSKSQNNLLKETFFEFYNETILSIDDHVFMYYAAEVLRSKGIQSHILWCNIDIIDWANFDIVKGVDVKESLPLVNDKDPQFLNPLSHHLAGSHHKFNPLGKTLSELVPPNSNLPRFHYNQLAHETIAKNLAEKVKCLIG